MARKAPNPAAAPLKKGRGNEPIEEEPLPENGSDVFTLENAKYEGEWKRFEGVLKRHGEGCFENDDLTYEGCFEEDKFHGHGTLKHSSGFSYVGEFRNGQISGQGEILFVDESRYSGQWRNGRMHGIGTFYTKDGRQWTGAWCHGMSTCPIFPQVIEEVNEEEQEEEMEGEMEEGMEQDGDYGDEEGA